VRYSPLARTLGAGSEQLGVPTHNPLLSVKGNPPTPTSAISPHRLPSTSRTLHIGQIVFEVKARR